MIGVICPTFEREEIISAFFSSLGGSKLFIGDGDNLSSTISNTLSSGIFCSFSSIFSDAVLLTSRSSGLNPIIISVYCSDISPCPNISMFFRLSSSSSFLVFPVFKLIFSFSFLMQFHLFFQQIPL